MKKRVLSVLLAIVMVVGLFPVTAGALPAAHHTHPVCGATHSDIGDHAGECANITWTEWNGTDKDDETEGIQLTEGSYYLGENITVSSFVEISGEVNLCLNGHSITSSGESTITVSEGAVLNICDCSTGETGGKIANTFYSNGRGINNSGTVNIYGGTIEATGDRGYGINNSGIVNVYGGSVGGKLYSIDNKDSGVVNISGGSVNKVIYNSGDNGIVNVSGGSVEDGTYGIQNGKGTVNISGGTVSGDAAGIRNQNGGRVTVSDGSVSSASGTGISNFNSGSTLTVSGGSVSGKESGIDNSSSATATVTDGTVTGVECGIKNRNSGTLTVSGGSITATGSEAYGIDNRISGLFNLSGVPTITGTAADISLYSETVITFVGELTYAPANAISVKLWTWDDNYDEVSVPGTFTSGWNSNMVGNAANYGSYFTSASSVYTVQPDGSGELKLAVPITYTVTYNGSGATSGTVPTDETSYASGSTVTVLGNTGNLAKTGYAFVGWNTLSSGYGTDYAPGDTFNINSNTTLYAQWEKYDITSQPVENDPSVGTNADGDIASYQWYKGTMSDVTDTADGVSAYTEDTLTSSYSGGWWTCHEAGGYSTPGYFTIVLNAGDSILAQTSSTINQGQLGIVGSAQDWDSTTPDDHFLVTAPADGNYGLRVTDVTYAGTQPTVKAQVFHIGNTPAEGATGKTLVADEDGWYACKITYKDGTVLYSGPVEYEAPSIPVTGVELSESSITLDVGGTAELTATISPNNATDKTVSWTSSDNNVATVKNGKVTAKKPGTATITVTTTDGSFTDTCEVTVNKIAITGPIAITTTQEPTVGQEFSLDYIVIPEGNYSRTGRAFSPSGSIEAGKDYTLSVGLKPNGGYYFADDVTATINGKAATVVRSGDNISIQYTYSFASPAANSVDILQDEIPVTTVPIVLPGIEQADVVLPFTAKVLDQYDQTMAGQTIEWSITGTNTTGISVNNGTVTVTEDASEGNYTLTATCDEAFDNVTIKVEKAESVATGIKIFKGENEVAADTIYIPEQYRNTVNYTAVVYDQYGEVMSADDAQITKTHENTTATGFGSSEVNNRSWNVYVDASTGKVGSFDLVLTSGNASASVHITFAKLAPQTIICANVSGTYGQTEEVKLNPSGKQTAGAYGFAIKSGASTDVVSVAADGKLTIKNAGETTILVTAPGDAAHASASVEVEVAINKADITECTAPTANDLTHSGSAQALITEGSATGGSMMYAIGTAEQVTGEWSTDIPTGTDIGTYYVWYKVVGDRNHNDKTFDSPVTVTVAPNKYTVKFVNEGGAVLQSSEVTYGETPAYTGETPTKAATDQYSYTFKGWTPEIETVTGDVTYTATYTETVNKYTVTFYDEDGTTVLESKEWEYGRTPVYNNGQNPTKTATAEKTYVFAGWSPAVAAVTGTASYTATFTDATNSYTVTWYDEDGTTVLETTSWPYGSTPNFTGSTPSKAADAQYTYTFERWIPVSGVDTDGKITGTAGFKAVYSATVNTYTVTWKNDDTVLETDMNVPYGATPSYDGDTPTKAATAQYTYIFKGWDKEIGVVTGNITYTAQFDSTINQYTVTYDVANGNAPTSVEVNYGDRVAAPADPAKEGYIFAGWYTDAEGGEQFDFNEAITENITLYAHWSSEPVYDITGRVEQAQQSGNPTPAEGVTVTLRQGNRVLFTKTTDADGLYDFHAPAGSYNIVAEKDGKTMTQLVNVTDHNEQVGEIILPYQNVSSELTIPVGTPDIVVGGLDEEVVESNPNATSNETHITLSMTVEQKEDVTSSEAPEYAELKAEQEEIKTKAGGQKENLTFLKIDLTKVITGDGAGSEPVTTTTNLLKIIIPFETSGRQAFKVYRYHGSDVDVLTTTTNADGEYIEISTGSIIIHAKKFSTYAIGYTVPASSGGYTPTYAITVEKAEHGTIKANRTYASYGSTVTITTEPEDGYVLSGLTVTDSQGNKIELTDKGDGTFTFKMPGRKVTIEASFAVVGSYSTCPGDSSCPIYPFTDADPSAWYHDGVHYCIDNGLMAGYGNGIFKPNADTTRAMITVMLWRLNGSPVVNYLLDFKDVEEGQWYTEAIRWAKSEGVAEGYGNGYFGTNDAITREQMVTILWRYAQYKGYDVSVGEDTNILSYDDAFDVAEYAIPAMQWACGSGMVQGMNDPDGEGMILAPESKGTRAQIATMIMRFCEEILK